MAAREQLIKARLAILALASELKNIAKACKLAGVSRSHFYEIRRAYKIFGEEGLAPRVRRKPNMPNRTPVSIEDQILLKTRANPTVGYIRLAGQMKLERIGVTPTMVRYVWQRHALSTRSARLHWAKRRIEHVSGSKGEDGPNKLDKVRAETCVPARTAPSSMSIGGTVEGPG